MLRIFLWISLVFNYSISAYADELKISAKDVLSAVSGYMQGFGQYRAILVQGNEGADLLFLKEGGDGFELSFEVRDIAATGIGGSDASLSVTEKGSLQVHSENAAIGRHRWQTTLTITHLDRQFVIGGFKHSFYDTLSLDEKGEVKTGSCDLNFLTGQGFKNDQPIKVFRRVKPVASWSVEDYPVECPED